MLDRFIYKFFAGIHLDNAVFLIETRSFYKNEVNGVGFFSKILKE